MTPRGPRRWRRRLLQLALLAVLLRILLGLFLAPLLGWLAGFAGLLVTVGSASLSITGASLRLGDVVVRAAEAPDGAPLFAAHALALDVSSRLLLRGELGIVDVELAAARIALQRRADGTFVLPAAFGPAPVAAPPPAPAADEPPPAGDFRLPFHLASARLHDLQIRVFDVGAPTPAVDLTIDATATDLGRLDRPGRIEVRATCPGWFDRCALTADLLAGATVVTADWRAEVRGVPPEALPLPAAAAGVVRVVRRLDLTLDGRLRGDRAPGGGMALDAEARCRLDGDGRELLRVDANCAPAAAGGAAADFAFALTANGIVDRLELTGTATAGDARIVRGTLATAGLTLSALQPLLAAQGLELPDGGLALRSGFEVALDDGLSASLHDLAIDGGGERLEIARCELRDLRQRGGALGIAALVLHGPTATVRIDQDGALVAAGTRLSPVASAPAPEPPAAHSPSSRPQLRIGSLRWTGAALSLRDERRAGPATLLLSDVDAAVDGLVLGAAAPPARLHASARLSPIVEALQLDATIAPAPTALALGAALRLQGIASDELAAWLPAAAGVRATDLSLRVDGALDLAAGTIDAEVRDLLLRDGDAAVLAVAALAGKGVQPAAGQSGPLSLRDVRLRLDGAGDQPAELVLDAEVDRLAPGQTFAAALQARIAGAVDRFDVRAEGRIGAGLQVRVDVAADGIHGERLSALLPAGLRSDLQHGRARLRVDAAAPAVGDGVSVSVQDLVLADGAREHLALATASLRAARRGDELHIDAASVRGLRAAVALRERGVAAAGFEFGSDAAPPPPPPDREPEGTTAEQTWTLPALRLADGARLDLERLELRDERSPAAEPLVIAGSLSLAPWSASAGDEPRPPAQLRLAARAEPVVGDLALDLAVDPLALRPPIDAALRARLDLTALPRVLPALADRIDGVTAALEVAADLHARLDLRRRDPRQFAFGRAFGGEVAVENVRVRDAAGDRVLASLDLLEAVLRAVDPASGDVLLRSLRLEGAALPIQRTAAGLEVAGCRLPAAASSSGEPPPTARSAPAARAPEFAVDHLQASSVAVSYDDRTTDPPTILPLGDADLELRRFTTRAFTEPRSFAFELSLRGGAVELDRRQVPSSLLAGVLGSAVAVTGLRDPGAATESRPLFEELAIRGQLQPFPHWHGDLRADLQGFELPALRGFAKAGGIDIRDGLADHSLALELRGPDGVVGRATTVFTWLSLSEPPGGPISSYLRLPAPLDTVLYLLRNDADEQRLALELRLPGDDRLPTALRETAAEAVLRLLAGALGGVPGRAVSAFAGALGLGGGPAAPVQAAVRFAAGRSAPIALELEAVARALAADPAAEAVLTHEASAEDLALAAAAVLPAPAAVVEQVERLRARRAEALAGRGALAAEVDALYGAGRLQEALARQGVLERHDEALGELERTLGAALAMLDDDSARAARRRATAAVRGLGAARLDEAVAALAAAVPGLAADRIVRRPVRAVATAELPAGGQVVVAVRRPTAR
jgi:hypothetical protein